MRSGILIIGFFLALFLAGAARAGETVEVPSLVCYKMDDTVDICRRVPEYERLRWEIEEFYPEIDIDIEAFYVRPSWTGTIVEPDK